MKRRLSRTNSTVSACGSDAPFERASPICRRLSIISRRAKDDGGQHRIIEGVHRAALRRDVTERTRQHEQAVEAIDLRNIGEQVSIGRPLVGVLQVGIVRRHILIEEAQPPAVGCGERTILGRWQRIRRLFDQAVLAVVGTVIPRRIPGGSGVCIGPWLLSRLTICSAAQAG